MFTVCYNCGTRHTGTFAVCPIFGTRQSLRHTATSGFPVVAAVPIGVQVLGQNGCMVVASWL